MPDMPSAPPAVPVSANSVSIKDFAFAPASVTVKAGTKLTWRNADQDPHTVTSTGADGPLRSKTLNTGDNYEYTFSKPGSYAYLCTIHPFMTAVVVVTP